VPPESWQLERVPDHLKITFRVVDDQHRTVAEDKDLERLRARLKDRMRAAISAAAGGIERRGLRTWSVGTLPRTLEHQRGGRVVKGYPALVDEGDSVAVRLLESEDAQQRVMWRGTRRLLLLSVPSPVKFVLGRLSKRAKLTLSQYPYGSPTDLFEDCAACAVDTLVAECGGPAWDEDGFGKLLDKVRAELNDTMLDVVTRVEPILAAAYDLEHRLKGTPSPALAPALADLRAQLSGLVYQGFVSATGWRRLPDVLRYLRAMRHRLDKLPQHPHRDQEHMRGIEQLQESYQRLLERLPPGRQPGEALREIRWMIEELRVSYFAQALGTPHPVSDKRVRRALERASMGGPSALFT
jgi:ATP-dependent helicase HrpA